jgi:1-acylglycerone phosphate reductase
LDLDIPDVRATFEVNVFGVMAAVAAFSDMLIAAKGLIINIASLAALAPYVFGSAYCATKGAIVSYSRTLRLELRPFGVRVMVAMVGTVASNIANRQHRSLPADSVYRPVNDLFEKRLVFVNNSSPVTTETFASELASNALASEWPLFLRGWLGRPDWFYYGGLAKPLWWGHTFLGEWLIDLVCWRMFGLQKLKELKEKIS